jgi:hypothetical protein
VGPGFIAGLDHLVESHPSGGHGIVMEILGLLDQGAHGMGIDIDVPLFLVRLASLQPSSHGHPPVARCCWFGPL